MFGVIQGVFKLKKHILLGLSVVERYIMSTREIYFAYGSNMNPDRMKEREAFFTTRVCGKLLGYRFSFSFARTDGYGSANITPEKNSVVYGALYCLQNGGLDKLDAFEMVKQGCYRREKVTVETLEGEKMEATTYVVTEQYYQEGLVPRRDYLNHCLRGKDILPANYYEFLEEFERVCGD